MNEIHHRLDLWTFTRFVDKTRFVDGFLGHEKSTNRVRGGFQKRKCKIYYNLSVINFLTKLFLVENSLICPKNPIDSHFFDQENVINWEPKNFGKKIQNLFVKIPQF